VTPELLQLYQTWGEGGIGIIVTGNIMIDQEHIEHPGNIILEDESGGRLQKLAEMAAISQQHGSVVGVPCSEQESKSRHTMLTIIEAIAQISHPGRQANKLLQQHPVSVSDVQLEGVRLGMQFGKPRPLSLEDIAVTTAKFAQTAYLCWKAGFAGVQLHAAHGYLLSSFLSRRVNTRVRAVFVKLTVSRSHIQQTRLTGTAAPSRIARG